MLLLVFLIGVMDGKNQPSTHPKILHTGSAIPARTTTPPALSTAAPRWEPRSTEPAPIPPAPFAFLHMTDLHISASRRHSLDKLSHFCESVYPTLLADVHFLAITGDFTDGIGSFFSLSQFGQQQLDWDAYQHAVGPCRAHGVPIFTIRGNHDCFGVSSFWDDSNSFFRHTLAHQTHALGNEIVRHQASGSYMVKSSPEFRFFFLEASRIAPSPHQFYGEFSAEQARWLEGEISGFTNFGSKMTYVFMHYPLGSLTPDSRDRLVAAARAQGHHLAAGRAASAADSRSRGQLAILTGA